MPSLLNIQASPRGDDSISRTLSNKFVGQWTKNYPAGQVVTRDLMKTELRFVDLPWIAGAFSPADFHSPEMKTALMLSTQLITELKAADHILIGTPMYNYSVPAVLKAYIDYIVRVNETFAFGQGGLVTGKTVTIIIASAGIYTPGAPDADSNYEGPYLKRILAYIGLTDVNIILAGGTDDVARRQVTLADHIAQFEPEVALAAR